MKIFRFSFTKNFFVYFIAILFFGMASGKISYADDNQKTISGKIILKETKEPIAGVAVFIQGTSYHTLSDAEGNYTLKFNLSDKKIIFFQALGMKDIAIKYDGTSDMINVEMEEDKEVLEEVVVTGYSNIRKEGFTGNTLRISQKELMNVSQKNAIATIQVFDPSFRIADNIASGADPNKLPEFYMRGQTGIKMEGAISRQDLTGNNNLPIFILDGFEVGVEKIYDMDPARISSLTLLKDAAATALYGSRAANGVVVITSRDPGEGKVRITYNLTSGVEFPDLSAYNLMNSKEKLEAEVKAKFYEINPDPASSDITSIMNYENYVSKYNNIQRGVDTEWIKIPVRTSFNHKHSIYIDGGEKSIRWGAELKFSNHDGIMIGSKRQTYGAGLTLDYRLGKFQFLNRLDFDVMHSEELPNQSFSTYAHLQPYAVNTDPDTGLYLRILERYGGSITRFNPLYELKYMNSFNRNGYNDISNKLLINFFATKDLTAKIQLSVSKKYTAGRLFIDPSSSLFYDVSDPANLGSLNTTDGTGHSFNFNALLLYNKTFGKNYFNITSGIELMENNSESVSATYTGFPGGGANSVNNAMNIKEKPKRASNKTRLASYIAMLNYSYDDIYLLDGSLRFDGSSEFGSNNKIAPFWAGGIGINIHNYKFLKGNRILSNLKLRATYGRLGKVNFPAYAARTSYVSTSSQYWYPTGAGYIMDYLGNDSLSWEKTFSFDTGFDLGMFENKFNLKFSFYNRTTTDMITSVTIPGSSGFTGYMDNIGKVRNKGIEIDMRITPYRSKNAEITLFGNLSHNKNTLLEISEALKTYNSKIDELYRSYGNDDNVSSKDKPKLRNTYTKFIEGGSTTSIFAMKSLGINPANGKEVFMRPDGQITYEWRAEDQVIVGNSEPKVRGAFGFNARYKQFSIFTSFIYKWGGQQYNGTLVNYVEDIDMLNYNADRRVLYGRWGKSGDIAAFKNIATNGYITKPSSRFVQNDNTLQFNSFSLSYDMNSEFISKMGISMMRFTLTMEDLGYWSTIRRERGIQYPFSKRVNCTLNLTF